MIVATLKSNVAKQFSRACAPHCALHASFSHWQLDVLRRRQRRHEIEPLKDKADVTQAKIGCLAVRQCRRAAAINRHRAGRRDIDSAEQVQQRALATPRWARDRNKFPAFDIERYAAHRRNGRVAHTIRSRDIHTAQNHPTASSRNARATGVDAARHAGNSPAILPETSSSASERQAAPGLQTKKLNAAGKPGKSRKIVFNH